MIGIETGATGIVLSTGERVDYGPTSAPDDLLLRIARGKPYVEVVNGKSRVLDSVERYVEMVAQSVEKLEITDPLALTVPGWWPPTVATETEKALAQRGVRALIVNDAEAAVRGYAQAEELPHHTTAVIGLRSRFVSLVLVQGSTHPHALPSPRLAIPEGGIQLDAAVLRHLVGGLESLGTNIDTASPDTIRSARAALEQCRNLRESLSRNATGAVQPRLPGVTHNVLLVRSELDELAEPWIQRVIDMTRSAFERADGGIGGVLLTGGLAGMPLISQRLSADLGTEVHVPDDLRLVSAKGAALFRPAPTRRMTKLWNTIHRFSPSATAHSNRGGKTRDGRLEAGDSLRLAPQ